MSIRPARFPAERIRGVSSATGQVALIPVELERAPRLPAGFEYVTSGGMALAALDVFMNEDGRATYDDMRLPTLLGGWIQDAVVAVASELYGNYPEVMPSFLVRSTSTGEHFQFVPEMHVDADRGGMGITLDQSEGFGLNKQAAVVRFDASALRFSVQSSRGTYVVEPSTVGRGPTSAESTFWASLQQDVPLLGSRSGRPTTSLFRRNLDGDARHDGGAVRVSGDGLRHLGIEPGVYPGFHYVRSQGLTLPRSA